MYHGTILKDTFCPLVEVLASLTYINRLSRLSSTLLVWAHLTLTGVLSEDTRIFFSFWENDL